MDLARDRERVVDRPAVGPPAVLGDEQGGHQRLEHAAAPPGHHAHAVIRVGTLEHVDAEVGPGHAQRLGLLPVPVAGVGEGAPGAEVLLRGQLALGDADVGGDPALADDGVVAARRLARVGRDVERDPVDRRPVVEPEVHAVEQGLGTILDLGDGRRDHVQAGREPAVVDRGQDGREGRAGGRPGRELGARVVVVPVVVLPARLVDLHRLERAQRHLEAIDGLGVVDEAEPVRDEGAPHVGADVRDRGLDARRPVRGQAVGREPRLGIHHGHERRPGVAGVAQERGSAAFVGEAANAAPGATRATASRATRARSGARAERRERVGIANLPGDRGARGRGGPAGPSP